jgi:alkylation response protein AidB-like acyl-CoA dehydrogenase
VEGVTRYHPSYEQLAVADAIGEALESLLPLSRVHASCEESAETWSHLDALGVFGIGVCEELGGSGLGAVEEALIVMRLGRHLAAPSVLATIGAALALSEGGTPSSIYRTAAAYRRGGRTLIVEDAHADLCLLRDGTETALYRHPQQRCKRIENLHWLDPLSEVHELGDPVCRFSRSLLLRLRLIDAAALAGIAEAALNMAVAYAGLREQFGRPIGSFQAVKHHCANMAISTRCALDQTSFAAIALDDGRPDSELQVECAMLVAGSAAIGNASKNIQVHGGIGFSDEADPHLLLKRTRLLVAIAGGLEDSNARIGGIEAMARTVSAFPESRIHKKRS